MANKKNGGFSVLEVLSTIAIITITASLLLSAITSAREKGLQAKCINNQKNLTAALLMFAHDYEIFPTELALLKNVPNHLDQVIQPNLAYADSNIQNYYDLQLGLTRCPKIHGEITDATPVYSYGINTLVQGLNLGKIVDPSETIVLTDSLNKTAVTAREDVDFRHFGGAIAGFADGHVEWIRFNQLTNNEGGSGSAQVNVGGDAPGSGGILFNRPGIENEEDNDNDDGTDIDDNNEDDQDELDVDDDEDDLENDQDEMQNENEDEDEDVDQDEFEDDEDKTEIDDDEDQIEDENQNEFEDENHNNKGHGNNADHDDEDNPGQGVGGHGHDHEGDTETSHDGIDDDELGGGNQKFDWWSYFNTLEDTIGKDTARDFRDEFDTIKKDFKNGDTGVTSKLDQFPLDKNTFLKGNNGVGNGLDPQPPGDPPINDGPGTSPGNPGNQGGVGNSKSQGNSGSSGNGSSKGSSCPEENNQFGGSSNAKKGNSWHGQWVA